MKLLVSPQSIAEAKVCIQSEVDIIDVKRPVEGSLGANFPWIIRDIAKLSTKKIPVSATLGDVSFQPGTISLAALGAATAGASFVKVGLFAIKSMQQGIELMSRVKQTIDEFNFTTAVVTAGYAEGEKIGSLDPLKIPTIAAKSNSDYAMLDTYHKENGKSLFDILSLSTLKEFIQLAREYKLGIALGGSLKIEHISQLQNLQPDIVGIRGAVCEQGDRLQGKMSLKLIKEFQRALLE